MSPRTLAMLAAVCLVAFAAVPPAHADSSRPWTRGVDAGRQARANRVFAEANELFARQAYSLALDRYFAAVALWEHPTIQFNLAVTLARLDRVLEAADAIDAALRFGEAPFTPELYRQATSLRTQVLERLGTIEASCTRPRGTVTLDGKAWFACPGKGRRRVLAEQDHAIVAEAPGFLTLAQTIIVAPGATAQEELQLVPLETRTRPTRIDVSYPVPRWLPWLVATAGAATAAVGVATYRMGTRDQVTFDETFATTCAMGCERDLSLHPELAALRDRASERHQLGAALAIGGGSTLVIGILWAALLNRPHATAVPIEVLPIRSGITVRSSWSF